jgi:hypothetical protein
MLAPHYPRTVHATNSLSYVGNFPVTMLLLVNDTVHVCLCGAFAGMAPRPPCCSKDLFSDQAHFRLVTSRLNPLFFPFKTLYISSRFFVFLLDVGFTFPFPYLMFRITLLSSTGL